LGDNFFGDIFLGGEGDFFLSDVFLGDSFLGDDFFGDSFLGDDFFDDSFLGDDFFGDSFLGDDFFGDSFLGDDFFGDSFLGDDFFGDSFLGDDFFGDVFLCIETVFGGDIFFIYDGALGGLGNLLRPPFKKSKYFIKTFTPSILSKLIYFDCFGSNILLYILIYYNIIFG